MQCSDHQSQDLGAFLVKTGFAEDYPQYSGGYYQPEQSLAKRLNHGRCSLSQPLLNFATEPT